VRGPYREAPERAGEALDGAASAGL